MFPVLARVGPLTLYTLDVFTLLGFAAGFGMYHRALRCDRLLERRIVLISVAALLGNGIGVAAHLVRHPRRQCE